VSTQQRRRRLAHRYVLVPLGAYCLIWYARRSLVLPDLLRVIHGLTAEQLNGSRVTYELTMSALNLIGGLVHDCPTAQPFLDKSPVLFELLAEHLGWPSDMYVTRVIR
jgi:hypothetical protein